MIEQRYIDILSTQKEDLLSQKRQLNFFQRLFFRRYTDWLVTDKIENWENKRYHFNYYSGNWDLYRKTPFKTQLELRMKLTDGKIEKNRSRV